MSTAEATALWKSFLEDTPPNTSVKISGLAAQKEHVKYLWTIGVPRLRLHCARDDGTRWFEPNESTFEFQGLQTFDFLYFVCRDCGVSRHTFAIVSGRKTVSPDMEVMKLGQFPPFGAPVPARIAKLLGPQDMVLYRKGKRAEAQGLGIGAAAYFRRIVDNQWKRLVEEIRDAAAKLGVGDLSPYEAALQETSFSKAVGDLKDALPPKLLILDNQNPLTLLYRPLSIELHTLTDEECLQQAGDIRVVLNALLENIAGVLADHDELKESAARLSGSATPPRA
jgi:hypothetical protein